MTKAEQFPLPMAVEKVKPNLLDSYRRRRDKLAEKLLEEADYETKLDILAAMQGKFDKFVIFFKDQEVECSECGHIRDYEWRNSDAETFHWICREIQRLEQQQVKIK